MIERLRALENRLRDEAGQHEINALEADSVGATEAAVGQEWRSDLKRELADELATLIAELGQEVGAVEPAWFYVRTPGADYDFTFTKTREEAIDLQDCDEPDEPIPLYTSPAHTSEARGAGETCQFFASGPEGSFFAKTLADAENLIDIASFDRDEWTVTDLQDAAMRQEAE